MRLLDPVWASGRRGLIVTLCPLDGAILPRRKEGPGWCLLSKYQPTEGAGAYLEEVVSLCLGA